MWLVVCNWYALILSLNYQDTTFSPAAVQEKYKANYCLFWCGLENIDSENRQGNGSEQ